MSPLHVWIRRFQFLADGGTVYARRNGAEEPLSDEDLALELDRRLAGLIFPQRLTVSSNSPMEMLSIIRGETPHDLELEEWWREWYRRQWPKHGPLGHPPTVRMSVIFWFFSLPEDKQRQPQTTLVTRYLEEGLPGAASNVAPAIAALKALMERI
jgi:hypothetical protein